MRVWTEKATNKRQLPAKMQPFLRFVGVPRARRARSWPKWSPTSNQAPARAMRSTTAGTTWRRRRLQLRKRTPAPCCRRRESRRQRSRRCHQRSRSLTLRWHDQTRCAPSLATSLVARTTYAHLELPVRPGTRRSFTLWRRRRRHANVGRAWIPRVTEGHVSIRRARLVSRGGRKHPPLAMIALRHPGTGTHRESPAALRPRGSERQSARAKNRPVSRWPGRRLRSARRRSPLSDRRPERRPRR